MKAYLSLVLQLFMICVTNVTAQSPPVLLQNKGDLQKVVNPDVTVTLPCPVAGDRSQMLFEWYKDDEAVVTYRGHRFRITASGSLRIKKTSLDDTGIYTCRAVNGFGSVENNATLVVMDDSDEDDYEEVIYPTASEEDVLSEKFFSSDTESVTTEPRLIYVTDWGKLNFHQLLGSTIQLHCVATGVPKPRISWTKDGGHLPDRTMRRRSSLLLQNLQLSHSGNYTCTATNQAGKASHSFVIDVTTSPQRSRGKPEMAGLHPSNTTVEEGHIAVLQCVVRSALPPHIQWLKRVEPDELHDEHFRDVIEMGEENFRVIKSSEVMDRADGSYFNKLVIQQPTIRDSGKYVCLGANTNGFNYRSAFLNILSRPSLIDTAESLPFPIVVAVVVLAIAAISGFAAILVYCRNRHSVSGSSTTSSNSTAVPMVTKDNCTHQNRRAKTDGSVSYEPPNRSNSHHHVTMYVPACHLKHGR